jgi:hypothetical protein
MLEKSSNKIDEKLLDKIIAVAYNDAGLYDRMVVWIKARRYPEIKKLLDEYKLTASAVHSLDEKNLSDSMVNSIKQRTNGKSNSDFIGSIIYSFASKPLLSASTAGIIILAIVSVLLFYNPPLQQKYTKAEIELAQRQLGESLAIVNKVFQNTEIKIDIDVLSKHVSKPLNKGLIYLNDYLIGG